MLKLKPEIEKYIEDNREYSLNLLKTIAVIPSPSNHEEKRAEFCLKWLRENGVKDVYIDSALNVVIPINCENNNDIVVFMAHSDVVFPDTTDLPISEKDGKLYCPGVGDDTANLVVILMVAKYIYEHKLKTKDNGVLLVINSGEEGLGNLKGSRKIVEDFGERITYFHSFDGCNCKVTNGAVGSKRHKIEIFTEGGHSYAKFGNRNAIAYMASLINSLYDIKVPEGGKTTFNVGTISGGTSVNTIAQHSEILYEIRSDRKENLEIMEEHLCSALDFYRKKGIEIKETLVGDRPCGSAVNAEKQALLDSKAQEVIKEYFCENAEFGFASTDCNIPLSKGIPSIGIGCYIGEGLHTREEFLEISSLVPGMKMGWALIFDHFEV